MSTDKNSSLRKLGCGARWERGWDTLTKVAGTENPAVVAKVAEVAPELARWIVEFGYGDAYSRPALEPAQRQLVSIGALTAMGGCEAQLKVHIAVALRAKVSPSQIIETIMHVLPYVGFPRALNALTVVQEVFEQKEIRVVVE